MRIVSWSDGFVYHLTRHLRLINSMTGAYSGIQQIKPFVIPTPDSDPQRDLGERSKIFNSYFSKRPNERITNISQSISALGYNQMLSNFPDWRRTQLVIYKMLSMIFN